jgi:hypothetical protein
MEYMLFGNGLIAEARKCEGTYAWLHCPQGILGSNYRAVKPTEISQPDRCTCLLKKQPFSLYAGKSSTRNKIIEFLTD